MYSPLWGLTDFAPFQSGHVKQQVFIRQSRNQLLYSLIVLIFFVTSSGALTRWSSLQMLPDADLLEGGKFLLSTQGYYFSDSVEKNVIKPMGMVTFGIIEWVNICAGYTGGANIGLKTRILGETRPWMPSLAIGVHNIFTHRDAYIFDRLDDSLSSELYLVLGKSVEPVRMRFHLGVQSIPDNEQERVNAFAAIEKYFGMGLYVTIETFMREKKMHPSLFVSWRFWKRHLEIATGLVDITGMFFSKDEVPAGSPFYRSTDAHFVRPGIWVGLKFLGGLKFGNTSGIRGLEDEFRDQSTTIKDLKAEIDNLKELLRGSSARIEHMNRSLTAMTDSSLNDDARMRGIAIDRLAMLKTLYKAEPFDPVAVNKAMAELVAHRDRMLSALYEIALDPVQETKIKALAITAMGEIGTQAAADIIIEILGQAPNPEMTIECLIALGKLKETRAVYLMQQLTNDPNDDVAFTAAEVLQKLEKETGIAITPVPAASLVPASVPEKKIGSGETYEPRKSRRPKHTATREASEWKDVPDKASSDSSMKKVEPVEFMEATVAKEPGKQNVSSPSTKVRNTENTPTETVTPVSDTPETNQPEPVKQPATERDSAITPLKDSVVDKVDKTDKNKMETKTDSEKNKESKKSKKKKKKKKVEEGGW